MRVVDNPRVTAAAAMNVGLAEAANDLVVRVDAHSVYAPDYVRRSVEALQESGADVVGGAMRPVGRTAFGRAVAAVTTSPVGIGNGRFHYAERGPGRRDRLPRHLPQGRGRGRGRLGRDRAPVGGRGPGAALPAPPGRSPDPARPDHPVLVLPPPDRRGPLAPVRQLRAVQGVDAEEAPDPARTGAPWRRPPWWPARWPPSPWGWRPAGPLVAVAPVVAWAGLAGVAAARMGEDPGVAPHRAFAALAICHWGYGLGFWRGIGRILTGRPFDTRPRTRK